MVGLREAPRLNELDRADMVAMTERDRLFLRNRLTEVLIHVGSMLGLAAFLTALN